MIFSENTFVRRIYEGQANVIVTPKIFEQPEEVVDWVKLNHNFKQSSTFYPGIRMPIPLWILKPVVAAAIRSIRNVFNIPNGLVPRLTGADFSLITREPSKLDVMQRLPHYDDVYPFQFAVLCYLSQGLHGGTGFFQHNKSKIFRLLERDEATYFKILQKELADEAPLSQYPSKNCPLFSLTDIVDFTYNTMAIYPGNLLHSALIEPQSDISPDIKKGRLTANIFIRFS